VQNRLEEIIMISKTYLRNLYENQGLSYRQIADLKDCCVSTVQYWIKKHGIQPRPRPKRMKSENDQEPAFQNKLGRVIVKLPGIMKSRAVLKAMAVIEGDWLDNLCVHHLNGNPSDDRYENLAIANHYIHQVSAFPNSKCHYLEKAMIHLARFAGLEDHMNLTDYGYSIDMDIELISEWDIARIANATLTVCGNCRLCLGKESN